MEEVIAQAPEVKAGRGSETMLAPQEVQRMLALRALGWGAKRISAELGCSRNTVREYLRRGGWKAMDVSRRASVMQPHREWLAERLRQHCGNGDVLRQDLERELGITVSLCTVQRAVEPLRRELRAEALATVRYETAPGQQLRGMGYVKRNAIAVSSLPLLRLRWSAAHRLSFSTSTTSRIGHPCSCRSSRVMRRQA